MVHAWETTDQTKTIIFRTITAAQKTLNHNVVSHLYYRNIFKQSSISIFTSCDFR